jgi:cytochrome c oxidase cbb3-type subunit III
MADKHIDEVTGVETTDHEWDGVRELNNPLPLWWLNIFYATVAFSVVYVVLFPALPMVTKATEGLLGYTARGEVAERIAAHAEMQAPWRARIEAAALEDIAQDPELFQFAMASGAANFGLHCSQCHGSGAAGAEGGFPNLNDDAWIWGGTLADIRHTIAHGVRNDDDPDARWSEMPRYGADGILGREEIAAAAQHLLAFTDRATKHELLELGAQVYADNCAACHGEAGEGGPEMGAPRLNDAIWLYGGSEAELIAQISNPQQGVMPAWGLRLDDATVSSLAVYVHSLGGGE